MRILFFKDSTANSLGTLLPHTFVYYTVLLMILVIFISTLGRMFYQLYLLVKTESARVCVWRGE